jgi:hypothetical protein
MCGANEAQLLIAFLLILLANKAQEATSCIKSDKLICFQVIAYG